ncbi:unnamed protein product [Symbiodinium sp. CCMP2456]|nr:unnamed protein product [Symbiodinium sp. CCMP2456]
MLKMDLTGSMSMSPNGNVVLRPRVGEAPDSSPWVVDEEQKGGNGRQSRMDCCCPIAAKVHNRWAGMFLPTSAVQTVAVPVS